MFVPGNNVSPRTCLLVRAVSPEVPHSSKVMKSLSHAQTLPRDPQDSILAASQCVTGHLDKRPGSYEG